MYWDDDFAFREYDQSNWDVWAELAECQELWLDTYRNYWGLDTDSAPDHLTEQVWKFASTTDELASVTLGMAMALSVEAAATPNHPLDLRREELKRIRLVLRRHASSSPQAKDRISLELADQALEQLKGSTNRTIRLIGLIRGKGLSERASQYVRRAARLYVWGFEPECAIMCRSALEAALVTALEPYMELDHDQPALSELLMHAGRLGLLKGFEEAPRTRKGWRARRGTLLWAAQRIQYTGNRAVHDFPALGQDIDDFASAFEALRELTVVLNALFPSRGPV